jgi:hypothetical protein
MGTARARVHPIDALVGSPLMGRLDLDYSERDWHFAAVVEIVDDDGKASVTLGKQDIFADPRYRERTRQARFPVHSRRRTRDGAGPGRLPVPSEDRW